MAKLKNVWVITDQADASLELCGGAAQLGETVTAVIIPKKVPMNADVVYSVEKLAKDYSMVHYIPTVCQLVAQNAPELILLSNSRNDRFVAAALAAAMGTSVLTDTAEISLGDGVTTKHMVYGGAAFRTERCLQKTAVACVGLGVFEAVAEKETPNSPVALIAPPYEVQLMERRAKVGESVNLGAAKKVVSLGRGLGTEENIPMAKAFARAIEAEIACSRPVAEEEKWVAKERYVGVSGTMIKPDVYFAVGISGQVQHMAGCNQSRTIVAINKDKNAPVFAHADYGIVGDLVKILPALTEKFCR